VVEASNAAAKVSFFMGVSDLSAASWANVPGTRQLRHRMQDIEKSSAALHPSTAQAGI
jgi:hypothetical protein